MVGWNRLNIKRVNSFKMTPSERGSVCSKMENLEHFQSDVSESQDNVDVLFKLKSMEKLIYTHKQTIESLQMNIDTMVRVVVAEKQTSNYLRERLDTIEQKIDRSDTLSTP